MSILIGLFVVFVVKKRPLIIYPRSIYIQKNKSRGLSTKWGWATWPSDGQVAWGLKAPLNPPRGDLRAEVLAFLVKVPFSLVLESGTFSLLRKVPRSTDIRSGCRELPPLRVVPRRGKPYLPAPSPAKFSIMSESRESNSDCLLPKQVYCHYTTLRKFRRARSRRTTGIRHPVIFKFQMTKSKLQMKSKLLNTNYQLLPHWLPYPSIF